MTLQTLLSRSSSHGPPIPPKSPRMNGERIPKLRGWMIPVTSGFLRSKPPSSFQVYRLGRLVTQPLGWPWSKFSGRIGMGPPSRADLPWMTNECVLDDGWMMATAQPQPHRLVGRRLVGRRLLSQPHGVVDFWGLANASRMAS